MKPSIDAKVGTLSVFGETLALCIGILDRERNGRGPENPESLKDLLGTRQAWMLSEIEALKKNPKAKGLREDVLRLEELVGKFDLRSLEEARSVIERMK